jgi:hypothetical protein
VTRIYLADALSASGRPAETLELVQPAPDPSAQLSGRPLGVGDHEDRVHVEPALADRADVALDQDRGLPGARAGGDEIVRAGQCA